MRETVCPPWFATQTSVAVTANAAGPASTRISAATRFPVRVSSWLTVPLRPLATHRLHPSSASASGPSPTKIGSSTCSVEGSMWVTVLSPLFATHARSARRPPVPGRCRRNLADHLRRPLVDPGQHLLPEGHQPEVLPPRRHRLG